MVTSVYGYYRRFVERFVASDWLQERHLWCRFLRRFVWRAQRIACDFCGNMKVVCPRDKSSIVTACVLRQWLSEWLRGGYPN